MHDTLKNWPHVSMCNNLSQTQRRRLPICQHGTYESQSIPERHDKCWQKTTFLTTQQRQPHDLIQMQTNEIRQNFFQTNVCFVQYKIFSNLGDYNIIEVEVVKYSELSTLLLSNFIAIFGVFVGAQHFIKFGS